MSPLRLVWRNLARHWVRTLLTVASLTVAVFLLCTLRSFVTALSLGAEAAKSDRLGVQSAVSLFVDMPLSYQPRIAAVEGVERVCKWQWFGGYYQDPSNMFGQFATDGADMLAMYPELRIVDGSAEAWLANRTGCLAGETLVKRFGWKVGDTVPIIGALFPHPEGWDRAWEFRLEAVYASDARTFDEGTLYFHWKYLEETLAASPTGTPGVGVFMLEAAPGADHTRIMGEVDALFENGPQRVQTTTEAEFQAQFASMIGSVPFFISMIGGAVLFAILLACVNTMLMAAREQRRDVGILKALGFTDGTTARLMLAQSLLLCTLGGLLGIALSKLLEPVLLLIVRSMLPAFAILPETLALALALALGIGVLAGLAPAWSARRRTVVSALGARE